jgi:hypothetical protein
MKNMQRYTAALTLCAYGVTFSPIARAQGEAEEVELTEDEDDEEDIDGDDASVAPIKSARTKALVRVSSTSDSVTVAQILGRSSAVGAVGGHYVVVAGVQYKDICNSPCSFELDPGLHEIAVYGDGIPSATKKLQLDAGEHDLVAKPGSNGLLLGGVWVTALGITAAVTGLLFMFVLTEDIDWDSEGNQVTTMSGTRKIALPLLLGGAAGTGLGIGMLHWGRSSLEKTDSGQQAALPAAGGFAGAPLGISYRGSL